MQWVDGKLREACDRDQGGGGGDWVGGEGGLFVQEWSDVRKKEKERNRNFFKHWIEEERTAERRKSRRGRWSMGRWSMGRWKMEHWFT